MWKVAKEPFITEVMMLANPAPRVTAGLTNMPAVLCSSPADGGACEQNGTESALATQV